MSEQERPVARIVLALFVAMLGLELGAGLYEARVVVPIWSADPQAARAFWTANAAFAEHAGQRWWMFSTPLCGLIGLITALLAGRLTPRARSLARAAGFGAVVLTAITFVYFVPHLMQLQGRAVMAMTAADAKAAGALWANLNWVRAAAYVVVWVAALTALGRQPANP